MIQQLPRLVARVPARVQTKLIVAFFVIVGLLIVVSAVGLQVLRKNNQRVEELIQLQRKIAAYQQLQHDTTSQLYSVASALVVPTERTLEATLRQLTQFGYDFDRLQFIAKDEAELLSLVQADYERFIQVINRVVELIRAGKVAESRALQHTEANPLADRLERQMNTLVNKAAADMVARIQESNAAYLLSQRTVLGIALASTMLALILGYALSGSLIGPVQRMEERMQQIASGDFSQWVEVPNRDELGVLVTNLNRMNDELKELYEQRDLYIRFIRQTFGRYLSNEVVTSLLDSPTGLNLGGEKRKVTLLMSDLRGFTTLSEHLQPEDVVTILNRYLGTMAKIILRYHGTINEFIGDGIFAIFGAPVLRDDDAERAVACAVEMQLAIDAVNADNRRENLPEIHMGIGIHTGEVVVGNIGSDMRAKYTVIGRHVNLTSRIESCTVGAQILISDATLGEVGELVTIAGHMQVNVKGVEAPLALYEVRGVNGSYNLSLPVTEETFLPLPVALPLRYTVVEGKSLGDAALEGNLVTVSTTGGEICSAHVVAPLSDIKIQLTDGHGHEVSGSLYAKVLMASRAQSAGFRVRFTSVAPNTAVVLQRLIASCKG